MNKTRLKWLISSLLIILFLSRFTLLIAGSNIFLAVHRAGQQAEVRAEASLTPVSSWETGRPKGSAGMISITCRLPPI